MGNITISPGEPTLDLTTVIALIHSGKDVDIKMTQLLEWLHKLLLLQNKKCLCGFDPKVADKMAAAVDLMVHRGTLDSRSVLADVRMDYRHQPITSREEAEEMLKDVQA